MAGHKKTYIASGIVVLTGLLFTITAFAGSGWAEPSSAAVPSPVPLSSEGMQAKQGGITVGSLYASVAQFNQQLFIAGTIKSDTGILHLNTTTGTGVVVSANLKASGILQADSIKNDSGAAPLCANSAGTVVLCDIVATVTPTVVAPIVTPDPASGVDRTDYTVITGGSIGYDTAAEACLGSSYGAQYFHPTNTPFFVSHEDVYIDAAKTQVFNGKGSWWLFSFGGSQMFRYPERISSSGEPLESGRCQ